MSNSLFQRVTRNNAKLRSSVRLTKMVLYLTIAATYLVVTGFMAQALFSHLYLIVYYVPKSLLLTSKIVAYGGIPLIAGVNLLVLVTLVLLTKRYVQLSAKKPDSVTPS